MNGREPRFGGALSVLDLIAKAQAAQQAHDERPGTQLALDLRETTEEQIVSPGDGETDKSEESEAV